jgi:hypothetical protein
VSWFKKNFIDECFPALLRHNGSGGGIIEVAPDTIILVDEDGNEVAAHLTDNEVDLTATTNDIRLGTTAITDNGVVRGEKDIPAYYTIEGWRKISAGSALKVSLYSDSCEYTKFQAIVCTFNTTVSDSVSAEKVSIDDKVYAVNSTVKLADVVVDSGNQAIDLSLTNNSDNPVIIRFFTYKEVH